MTAEYVARFIIGMIEAVIKIMKKNGVSEETLNEGIRQAIGEIVTLEDERKSQEEKERAIINGNSD